MSDITVQRASKDYRTLPVFAEAERTFERIRQRAYELFEGRSQGQGGPLDDWLAAERELNWPAAELTERGADYLVSVALPGFEADDISLTATPRTLFVQARTRSERKDETKKGEATLHWSEIRSRDVCRRIDLAKDVDVDKVSAQLKNGMLKIVARKVETPAKPVAVVAAA